MNGENEPQIHEVPQGELNGIDRDRRFKRLLEDPVSVVDRWKRLSDLMDQTDDKNPNHKSLETVCLVLGRELVELTQTHPRHAAELIAEILRREDQDFSLFAHTEPAILYLAGQDELLAQQLWEMFTELYPEGLDESTQHIHEELRTMTGSDVRKRAPVIVAPHADRVAMAMFYMNHVSQHDTL
ncbi:hypothetical protein [Streptomyces sp. NPDC001758]